MTASLLARLAVLTVMAIASTGCANTIRGLGRDTANTVDAAQNAGENVAEAAD
jgi:entericidin B